MAALEQAARDKSNALALIEAREREIRAIRDGQITSKKVRNIDRTYPMKVLLCMIVCDLYS